MSKFKKKQANAQATDVVVSPGTIVEMLILLAHPAVAAYEADRLEDPVLPITMSPPGPFISNSLFTVTELPETGSRLFTLNVLIDCFIYTYEKKNKRHHLGALNFKVFFLNYASEPDLHAPDIQT